MVRDTGFEPVTPSVSGRCSTTELTALDLSSGGGECMTVAAALATSFIDRAAQMGDLVEMSLLAILKKRGGRSADLPPLTIRHP